MPSQPTTVACKTEAQSEHVFCTFGHRFECSVGARQQKFPHRSSVGSSLRPRCWLGSHAPPDFASRMRAQVGDWLFRTPGRRRRRPGSAWGRSRSRRPCSGRRTPSGPCRKRATTQPVSVPPLEQRRRPRLVVCDWAALGCSRGSLLFLLWR